MARYLSRAELSCIAGKYIEMYYALFGISKNDPAPINPEQFANSVLGLNLKMLPLCSDGHILGLTFFQRCSFTATLEDGTKLVEVFMPRDIVIDSALAADRRTGCRNFTIAHEAAHQILADLFPNDYGKAVKCRGHIAYRERNGKPSWEEWQADTLAAELLMPTFLINFGMTEREEALLFAQQTGISERLSAGQKLRALIFAGEPAAVAFQQATELAGVHLSFEEGRGKQRISCIATAYHEFIRLGPELYIESLDVLLNAWNGETDSMSSANLLGICRFVELYHSEYNKGRLIAKLRQVDAFTIFRLARTAGVSLPGKTKYLQQVYTIYNGGSRRAALPLKF